MFFSQNYTIYEKKNGIWNKTSECKYVDEKKMIRNRIGKKKQVEKFCNFLLAIQGLDKGFFFFDCKNWITILNLYMARICIAQIMHEYFRL